MAAQEVPRKDFVIKKFGDEHADMTIARLHKMWSDDMNAPIDVDFSAYKGLELFWEQAPMVEEDDEKVKEFIIENEALAKLDGKTRKVTRGIREPRWVLRDSVRKKAEKHLKKEAEQKNLPPPHDTRLVNIKKGGLLMLGSKEGVLKAPVDHNPNKNKKVMTDDTSNARYAIMVQTGDNEVSIANVCNWLTFRGPQLTGSNASNTMVRPKKPLTGKKQRLMNIIKQDEEKRNAESHQVDVFKPTKAKGSSKRVMKGEGSNHYDGYDQEDTGAAGTYMAAEFLDGMQEDGDEEAPDNEDRVRSDDEAGSDGRDDALTCDVNNDDLDSSDDDEESDLEDDAELDEESKQKLDKMIAKMKAAQKNQASVQDGSDESDVNEEEEDTNATSRSARYLGLNKPTATDKVELSKKRVREGDQAEEAVFRRGRMDGYEVAASFTSSTVVTSSGERRGISEAEVKQLLEQYNGRMKTKDLKKFFKARLKVASVKQDLIDILQHLVVKQTDEVEGQMYVLKARQFA